ncbi:MAG: B12-binding domain-containing radical SAM protein [Candidatus Eremiobacteraeota bacterium]|nr:B12-binding domain-containing radical SAM protein [Candidatus Eremiobacteraeota bacterium]
MKLKIALISARGAERFYADSIFEELEKILHREIIFLMEDMEWMPNLGLITLAGVIDPSHDLLYVDEEYLLKETMDRIVHEEDFDLVCLSVINTQYKRSYQMADIYRDRGIPVAMGGIHPTALPEEAGEHADFIFVGEAEDTFREFLDDFQKGNAKQVYRSKKLVDLTLLPPPRFDLLNQFNYIEKYNRFPIQATRGCPRKCDFCFLPHIYGAVHRHKTVQQVVNEIKTVKSMVEQPFISFTDENMFIDVEYSKELIRSLIPLNILWECYCDIAVAKDKELLDLLYQSHCALLLIGLETINPKNLEGHNPWKHSKIKDYRQAIDVIQSHGVGVSGLFIVGFDDDDISVFRQIRDFAYETNLVDTEVSALCPFPGTRFYDRMEREGRILTRDWEKFTWIHMNFQPKKMTPDEIMRGLFWLFKEMVRIDRLIYMKKYFRSVAGRLYGKEITREGKPTFLSS